MCGIAGAVGWIDPDVREAVRRMTDCQRHRGPDADGAWASDADGNLGAVFGHRRLAIIDLRPESDQPMIDEETGNVIVFNGEIYNFQSIRRELEKLGARFRTNGDTEVILRAYARWGRDCVRRFRGMFAFVLWDAARREAFAARDRLGIKPLYWCTVERQGRRTLLFASEVRAILETGLVARRIDPVGLSTYLWNGFVVGPNTIARGLTLFPEGSTGHFTTEGSAHGVERYWQLPRSGGGSRDTAPLASALAEAVRLRLVSDVPLGVFLSGGVDSSAVAALASREVGRALKTFTITFEESEYDEAAYARRVAAAIASDHREIPLGQRRFTEELPAALDAIDQPTFDLINTYFVSKAVREAGITVALAGVGGDELFGGYASFADIPRARPWTRALGVLPATALQALGRAVARWRVGCFGEVGPQTRWGKLGDVLATRGRLPELYQVFYALFTTEFRARLMAVDDTAYYGIPRVRIEELRRTVAGPGPLHRISLLELSFFVTERLLRDTDVASMASSLEVRVPLIDHEVVEACARLDEDLRYLPLRKKALLKQLALKDMDMSIFDRPKSGFVLPLERWCRQELEGEINATLTDAARCEAVGLDPKAVGALWRSFQAGAPGMYWSRVWSLFVLLRWARKHGMTI